MESGGRFVHGQYLSNLHLVFGNMFYVCVLFFRRQKLGKYKSNAQSRTKCQSLIDLSKLNNTGKKFNKSTQRKYDPKKFRFTGGI
jgi:hypothetical protein